MSACVAVCCSVLQCAAVCCSASSRIVYMSRTQWKQHTATHCNTLQQLACCSMLQRVAVCCSVLHEIKGVQSRRSSTATQCNTYCNTHCNTHCNTPAGGVIRPPFPEYWARRSSSEVDGGCVTSPVLQCVAVCCSVLQRCVAVCCKKIV